MSEKHNYSEKSTTYPSSEASGQHLLVRDWTDAGELKPLLDISVTPRCRGSPGQAEVGLHAHAVAVSLCVFIGVAHN
jgi:hypothetical protein